MSFRASSSSFAAERRRLGLPVASSAGSARHQNHQDLSRFQTKKAAASNPMDSDDDSDNGIGGAYYDSEEEEEERLLSERHGEAQDMDSALARPNGKAATAKDGSKNNSSNSSSNNNNNKRKKTDEEIAAEYNNGAGGAGAGKKSKNTKPRRKPISENDLVQPNGLSAIFAQFPEQFHNGKIGSGNKNKDKLKYKKNRKDMTKFSRQLINAYQQWANQLVPGTPLEEVMWKVQTLNSKTTVKRFLQTMRNQVRNEHVERIYGLEQAENMISQLDVMATMEESAEVPEGEEENTAAAAAAAAAAGAGAATPDSGDENMDANPTTAEGGAGSNNMAAATSGATNNENGDYDDEDMYGPTDPEDYEAAFEEAMADAAAAAASSSQTKANAAAVTADDAATHNTAAAAPAIMTRTSVNAVTPSHTPANSRSNRRRVLEDDSSDEEELTFEDDDEDDIAAEDSRKMPATPPSTAAAVTVTTTTPKQQTSTPASSSRRAILEDSDDDDDEDETQFDFEAPPKVVPHGEAKQGTPEKSNENDNANNDGESTGDAEMDARKDHIQEKKDSMEVSDESSSKKKDGDTMLVTKQPPVSPSGKTYLDSKDEKEEDVSSDEEEFEFETQLPTPKKAGVEPTAAMTEEPAVSTQAPETPTVMASPIATEDVASGLPAKATTGILSEEATGGMTEETMRPQTGSAEAETS